MNPLPPVSRSCFPLSIFLDLFGFARPRVICVECNWQNINESGVFRVMETVTLKIVNLLWDMDLCATLFGFDSVRISHNPHQILSIFHIIRGVLPVSFHIFRVVLEVNGKITIDAFCKQWK